MRIRKPLSVIVLAGTIAFGLAQTHAAHQADPDAAAKIESAMTAAPPALSDQAPILDNTVDDAGKFVVLREGSNGSTCFPDIPTSPGNDPACYDATWMDWNHAFLAGEAPSPAVSGLAYVLQGGSDANNTEPMATEPAAGDEWVRSAPHVMHLLPGSWTRTSFDRP